MISKYKKNMKYGKYRYLLQQPSFYAPGCPVAYAGKLPGVVK
jgi:hypothetical protein